MPRTGEVGDEWGVVATGYELSLSEADENVSKLACGNGCTTMWTVNMLKKFVHFKWVNFMACESQ